MQASADGSGLLIEQLDRDSEVRLGPARLGLLLIHEFKEPLATLGKPAECGMGIRRGPYQPAQQALARNLLAASRFGLQILNPKDFHPVYH